MDATGPHADYSYYPVVAVTVFVFAIIFMYVSPWLSARWTPRYGQLTPGQRVEWDSRVLSNVHAVVSCVLCIYLLGFGDLSTADPIWPDSPLARVTACIVMGYMIVGESIAIWHYQYLPSVADHVHHSLTVFGAHFLIAYGPMLWWAMIRLASELSTPFVNQRWFLDRLQYARTSIQYRVNGYAMLAVFFLCRIVVMPFYYPSFFRVKERDNFSSMGWLWHTALMITTVGDTLNVIWAVKMIRGAYRIIKRKRLASDRD